MLRRRDLLGAATASLALVESLKAGVAQAAGSAQAADAMHALAVAQPRGADGRLLRLGTLDLESQQDFTLGFRLMHSKELRKASSAAFERVLADFKAQQGATLGAERIRAIQNTR